ncbi:hypothetical protein GUITHDRAFT_148667 [Guillardia theta CCMP2712]|uniref:Nudix hydrolase domain-containing protein n=1 Tax=Guillardia theta (strain CCMP2712) TaxID=905079 RepID=L1I7Z7_GUITC|nr:hypothetical protein GUITHDRAFT_148667 [Guillardia theta CCMP2712]EKX32376.1 hypothetical protein GUITHDRAFT_148667 [Guillardia theta CCMP2712]|eukprot:XP_005819356.1 hypothetical protein GUITHDRAFT_148667 [Guillardia theta CCMP2712]
MGLGLEQELLPRLIDLAGFKSSRLVGRSETDESLLHESGTPERPPSTDAMIRVVGDSGYRAFVIAKHSEYGYLLLEANKKRKGGRHFQLPGGHVDAHEISQYGIDEGSRLYRLAPIEFHSGAYGPQGVKLHETGRRFFRLDISDVDSVQDLPPATPLSMEDFRLCLSREHTGFRFQKSPAKAAELVTLHSGGKSSLAITLYESSQKPQD